MPYETGRPSCQNYGLYPSPKYSGLCVSEVNNYNNNYYDTDNNIISNDDSYYQYKSYSGTQHHSQSSLPNQYGIKNYNQQQPSYNNNNHYQQPQQTPKYQPAYHHPPQQQQPQKQRTVKPVDQLSPFLTYRWDLLFKNVVNLV